MTKIGMLKKGDCIYYVDKYAMRCLLVKEVSFGLSGATITTVDDETYQITFISDVTGSINGKEGAITTDMVTGRTLEIELATDRLKELTSEIEFVGNRINHAMHEIEKLCK